MSAQNRNALRSTVQPSVVHVDQRLPAIDGLRATACLFVVVEHSLINTTPSVWPTVTVAGYLISLTKFIREGFAGVDLFFVLSGFCLCLPMFYKFDRPFRWRLYLEARAWRILPPFWGSLILWISLAFLFRYLHNIPLQYEFSTPSLKELLHITLLVFLWGNPVYWTLLLEARWYFVLPILVAIIRKLPNLIGVSLMLIFTIAVSVLFSQLHLHNGDKAFLLTTPLPIFLPQFGFGIAVAWLYALGRVSKANSQVIGIVSLAGLLMSLLYCVIYPPPNLYSYDRVVPFGLLGTFALLTALYFAPIRRVLAIRPLVRIGEMSYSVYLIHLIVVQIARVLTRGSMLSPAAQTLRALFLVFPTAVAFGCLFFYVVERPLLQWRVERRNINARTDN